jgi:hypothetical protein
VYAADMQCKEANELRCDHAGDVVMLCLVGELKDKAEGRE